MNSQPEGHPTDVEIATARKLDMDPWEIMRIMDAWLEAFDEVAGASFAEEDRQSSSAE